MRRLCSFFLVDTSNLMLLRAQLGAFSKQVPLLYFILSVNTVTLAFTHYGKAPYGLTVIFPGVVVSYCLVRSINWLKVRHRLISDREAINRLYGVVILGGILGAVYLLWALLLYDYGDPYTKSHVAFFAAVTVISSIFCLMHLRAAALALMAIIVIPFSAFLLFTQGTTFVAIGINLLLVSAAMIYILIVISTDFEKMINSQIETARLSDENHHMANIDSLTELPNRRHFFQQLEYLLTCARHEDTPLVVGVIDLDGFKAVNDIYGHATGDRVLQTAGQRLQRLSSDTILIARLGGDEFGVLITRAYETEEILAFGEQVCTALQAPFSLPEAVAKVSGSVGFAIFPEAGETAELLYERADYALNYAKERQRGSPTIFSKFHETEIRTRSAIEQALRSANLETELSLHFQPLFDVEHGRPVAFEALARWHSPELGNIPPDVFIGIAERSELINTLTQTLLCKALAAAKTWPENIHVSFNLSVRDILSMNSMKKIIEAVEHSGIDPRRIGFEVTESALMGDFDQARESIDSLRALGTKIALDDFGTGYSSLSYVHRLPLDTIKIDRSFVMDIETRTTSRNIIRTIVDLCRNLDIGCVVEGMETATQVKILRSLGCETMQGYFFSKPIPEKDVLDFLFSRKPALKQDEAVSRISYSR